MECPSNLRRGRGTSVDLMLEFGFGWREHGRVLK